MLDIIRSALDKDGRISDWIIKEVCRSSHQVYTSLGEQEAIRAVSQKRWFVTLFTPLADSGDAVLTGHTNLEIVEGETCTTGRIDAAIEQARLHGHAPFDLPVPGGAYPDFDGSDSGIRNKPWETLSQLNDEIEDAVNREKNIELASSELFLDHAFNRLINSNGLDLTSEESRLTWDVCLLHNDGNSDTEFWEIKYRPGARCIDVGSDIARFAQYARDAAIAVPPKTGSCPIVLTGDHLYVLLQYFLHHSYAGSKYNGSALFEPGKPVLPEDPQGDILTIFSNALHPDGIMSYRFDDEGLPGRRIPIINQGILKQFWATSQHAAYLGIPPTGMFGNIEIPPGTFSWKDLFRSDDRVILVLQFSTFDPQPVAGNYLGEIRVGYEFRVDGSVIPLRGGSVTGNVVDGMTNCRFSRECDTFYGYFGPRGIRFGHAQIAGE